MIPAIVAGVAATAAGVALLSSGDDDKKNSETTSVRRVSEDYVKQKMAKSGRQIKTVGGQPNNYKIAESPVERVKQIIATQLDLDENSIHMSDRIIEDLGANYNDKCLILDLIGEEFNVKLFGKEIRTVGNIFNYIS